MNEPLTGVEYALSRFKESLLAVREQRMALWRMEEHRGAFCPYTRSAIPVGAGPLPEACTECGEELTSLWSRIQSARRTLSHLETASARRGKLYAAAFKRDRQCLLWAGDEDANDTVERLG